MAIRIFPTTNDIGTYPGEGRVLSEKKLTSTFSGIYPGRIVYGFNLPVSNSTLTLGIPPGQAIISGYLVDVDTNTYVTCTANSINYIWLALTRDTLGNVTGANFVVETTGTQPTDSILIGIAVTDSSTVISTQTGFYEFTPYYYNTYPYYYSPYWGVVMRDATTADGLKGTVVSGTPTYLTINPGLIKINDKYYHIPNPQKFIIDTSTARTDGVILRYYLRLQVPVIIYKKGPYTLTQNTTMWETEIGKVNVSSTSVTYTDLRRLITDFKYPSITITNTITLASNGWTTINNLSSGTITNELGSIPSISTTNITFSRYGIYHIDFLFYPTGSATLTNPRCRLRINNFYYFLSDLYGSGSSARLTKLINTGGLDILNFDLYHETNTSYTANYWIKITPLSL